jgi:hypothetical protein
MEGWAVTGLALVAAGVVTRRWPDRVALRQLPVIGLLLIVVLKARLPAARGRGRRGSRRRADWLRRPEVGTDRRPVTGRSLFDGDSVGPEVTDHHPLGRSQLR